MFFCSELCDILLVFVVFMPLVVVVTSYLGNDLDESWFFVFPSNFVLVLSFDVDEADFFLGEFDFLSESAGFYVFLFLPGDCS